MKNVKKLVLGIGLLGMLGAESAYARPERKAHPHFNQRLRHQNRLIRRGERTGQITYDESAELRANQREIRQEKRGYRKENGGYLTPEQRQDIRQDLREQRKDIFQEKHDTNE